LCAEGVAERACASEPARANPPYSKCCCSRTPSHICQRFASTSVPASRARGDLAPFCRSVVVARARCPTILQHPALGFVNISHRRDMRQPQCRSCCRSRAASFPSTLVRDAELRRHGRGSRPPTSSSRKLCTRFASSSYCTARAPGLRQLARTGGALTLPVAWSLPLAHAAPRLAALA
jgi:hypothetical protein